MGNINRDRDKVDNMNYKPSAKMLDLIMPLARELDISPVRLMEMMLLEGYKSRDLIKEDIKSYNNLYSSHSNSTSNSPPLSN